MLSNLVDIYESFSVYDSDLIHKDLRGYDQQNVFVNKICI